MRVVSLFSGSKGNATLVDTGACRFLIDAGGSLRLIEEMLERCGVSPAGLSAVFVTHEHGDHTHGLPLLAKRYRIPIHITAASAAALRPEPGSALADCLVTHDREFGLPLEGGGTIEAFAAPHDSVCCVGYRVDCGGESFGMATDLGYVTQRVYDRLRGCRAVMIEANHDCGMVRSGPYPEALKQRILSGGGHLSNQDCAEVVRALARSGTRAFLLAHLSRENNEPGRAAETVRQALDGLTPSISVAVAAADGPTVLL